jgi:hypothetical protein
MQAMFIKRISSVFALAAALVLASCGGGGDEPCGEKKQAFGIAFSDKAPALKVGQAATLKSTVLPESCRTSITFAVKNGALPDGMALVNGDVAGTPTKAGTFKFQVFIEAVEGYESVFFLTAPRSDVITVTVAP